MRWNTRVNPALPLSVMAALVERPYTEDDLHAAHAGLREKDEGVEVRYDKDPLSTFGQRLMSGFIGILPVESQL